MIYHIAAKETIKRIISTGIYSPEGYIKEGFIHCSTEEQVVMVANRFYSFQNDLILLKIDDDKLKARVIFENLEGGTELFPHVYGPIHSDAIVSFALFPYEENGFSYPLNWATFDNTLTW